MMTSHATAYAAYISSPQWQAKRADVLARDRYECQTCCTTDSLEVHHRHYRNFGNEALADLITLCSQCHEAITNVMRGRRYEQSMTFDNLLPIERTTRHGITSNQNENHWRVPDPVPQRADGRSAQFVRQGTEGDQQ
jgi:5-methylcytosine-specific restriction endonuclease McrA